MVIFEYAGSLIKKGLKKLGEGLSWVKNKLRLPGSVAPRAFPPVTPRALPPGEPSILREPPEPPIEPGPYREPGEPTSTSTPDPTPKDPWSRVEPEIDKINKRRK
jgi:hypothetical protein